MLQVQFEIGICLFKGLDEQKQVMSIFSEHLFLLQHVYCLMLKGIFTGLCLPFKGKRLANVLCEIIDNLDATENRKSREEAHGASNEAKSALHREGEVVLNLVVRGAPNTNYQNLELVRQNPL